MILGRLQVRGKLNLLIVVPLVMVVLLLVPLLTLRVDQARSGGQTSSIARTARDVSGLIGDIQRTRLLAVAYLSASTVAPDDLLVQVQQVEDSRLRVRAELDRGGAAALRAALDDVAALRAFGSLVTARQVTAERAASRFAEVITQLIDALSLTRQPTAGVADSWALGSLDALLRADEAAVASGVLTLVAVRGPAVSRPRVLANAAVLGGLAQTQAEQFRRLATPTAALIFAQTVAGASTQRLVAATARVQALGAAELPGTLPVELYSAIQSQSAIRRLVETRITQDVVVDADASAAAARASVLALTAGALVLLALVVTLSVVVGRSVSRPLRRLTSAAVTVADLARDELLRVADEDAQVVAVPQLAAIDVRSADEIGELAEAFNRVQATAAMLLERQVGSRRNVAAMFAGVGRRTSNLVGRQLALIDRLERAEDDPDTLATLYRLDHVSTRLRRSASSLIVLSGDTEAGGEGRPLALDDAIRGALGTVEDFQRVVLGRLPDAWLAPNAASDVVLLLAELIENALLFSPPQTHVDVDARLADDGDCVLSIVDHGMGMPVDRLAQENARLERRERLDLAPSDVLGLFVVGRIARRHGVAVRLEATEDHGVTARVQVPSGLLVDPAVASLAGVAPVAGVAPTADPPGRPDPRAVTRPRLERAAQAAAGRAPTRVAADAGRVEPSAAAPPGSLRRRVPGARWVSQEDHEPLPPDPAASSAADRVSGVPRRVPGARLTALEQVDRDTQPISLSSRIDPDEAREQVEALEQALARAEEVAQHGTVARRDAAQQVAPVGLTRRIPGAVLARLQREEADARSSTQGVRVRRAGTATAPEGEVDAAEARRVLDEVSAALLQAREVGLSSSVSRERRAAQRGDPQHGRHREELSPQAQPIENWSGAEEGNGPVRAGGAVSVDKGGHE